MDKSRYFDPDPTVRRLAEEIYSHVKDLPLVCPHGHVDPSIFSENKPFPNPTELLITPDHYVFRMLYSQGIPLESLGVPLGDGAKNTMDPRKAWSIFCEHFYLFHGTPTGAWLTQELEEVFEVKEKLNKESAGKIYDQIDKTLKNADFLPRALYKRFNIEVLTTTDGACDDLAHHVKIKESGWDGRVIPCFRPDDVCNLETIGWKENIRTLSQLSGISIHGYGDFIQALEARRAFFISMGAVSTDHGVFTPHTHKLDVSQASRIFEKALRGDADLSDAKAFTAHMLMVLAQMSVEDGLVMQIHPGSFRNHNRTLFERFGPDKGCDIPVRCEFTQNLYELLNAFGNNPRFQLILFTLDESAYARELAPLAGHYPAVKLGPPWWFHDSIEGMKRYRSQVTETAGVWNTAGFNDDTRAFLSIPARHDLNRRVDSNYLAQLTARGQIDMEDALIMGKAMAYDLVKASYNLNEA